MSDAPQTIEDVLREHRERMRALDDADLKVTANLAKLNSLLIYRTATAGANVHEKVNELVEKIILESGDIATNEAEPG